ncbi:Uncharacterised protein [Citrobacter koseri]|uniref:Uncharacterized protein n=1 Tax=Citrobacter koseri TaxID=545 RepID=A0A447UVC2_CITKO|nr:Uncharacterised protein [Citrobacter koseri]
MASGSNCAHGAGHAVHDSVEECRFILIILKMPLLQFSQLCGFGDGVVEVTQAVYQTIRFCILTGPDMPCAILSICAGVLLRASATSVIKRL